MEVLTFIASILILVLSIVNNLKLEKMGNDNQAAFDAVMDELDKGTNEVAAELESLKGVIASAGLNSAQEKAILDRLQQQADRLKSMASTAPSESPATDTGGAVDTGTGDLSAGSGSGPSDIV